MLERTTTPPDHHFEYDNGKVEISSTFRKVDGGLCINLPAPGMETVLTRAIKKMVRECAPGMRRGFGTIRYVGEGDEIDLDLYSDDAEAPHA